MRNLINWRITSSMMLQLSVMMGLMLTSLCLSVRQQQQQPISSVDENVETAIQEIFGDLRATSTPTPIPDSLFNMVMQTFSTGTSSPKPDDNNDKDSPVLDSRNLENAGQAVACKCVPYYQCENGTINTSGHGLFNPRGNFADKDAGPPPSVSVKCESVRDVCCRLSDNSSTENPVTLPPVPSNKCGRRNADGVDFGMTANGPTNKARFGEFPWMVAVLKKSTIGTQSRRRFIADYQCSGALIHAQAVLTAAHCLIGWTASMLEIRAGEWNTEVETEVLPSQDRDVGKMVIHEKFDSSTGENDFAILVLKTPVNFALNVDTVCLPRQNDSFDTSRCFASGWGQDVHEGRYQAVLKKIELLVVPHDMCQNFLRHSLLGRHFVLSSSFICAVGEPDNHSCKGDGGGPLVCPLRNDPTRYVQAGIVAWGIRCGNNGMPGAYANVAAARGWIDEKLASDNLDNPSDPY